MISITTLLRRWWSVVLRSAGMLVLYLNVWRASNPTESSSLAGVGTPDVAEDLHILHCILDLDMPSCVLFGIGRLDWR